MSPEINFRRVVLDVGLSLALYTLLTLALTWPLIRDFSSQLPGSSLDVYHNVWIVWHTREALLTHEPLFGTELLYYPAGISLLLHGIGPLTGLFALPFWPWGPVAAYNGMILVSFVLTGTFMYWLARGLGFDRPVALFAGTLLLAAPMHLVGVRGHIEKIFIGLLPLALLTLHHALDLTRSRRWAIAFAIVSLLTLLHNGLQFVLVALSATFFVSYALATTAGTRRPLLARAAFLAGASLLLGGPLLLATIVASRHPAIPIDLNYVSASFAPDLVEFFLPPPFTRFWGQISQSVYDAYGIDSIIETAVYLSWTGLLLSAIAFVVRRKRVLPWLIFCLMWAILALGPSLQLLGRSNFTEYELPIILPYTLLTALPGLDFLRTPGRLMLVGFVGLGIAASFGLAWLRGRFPRAALPLTLLAIGLVLLETWPEPWWQQTLPATPAFYEAIAGDPELYGVLDLPLQPWWAGSHVDYSARYQMHQVIHGKGIALGYISRTYRAHPLFPCLIPKLRAPSNDVLVDGKPSPCYANALFDLAYYNYRYLVWHKPQASDSFTNEPGQFDEASSFALSLVEGRRPLVNDALTTVYAIPSSVEAASQAHGPVVGLGNNWYGREDNQRWAKSPATLWLSTPHEHRALLEITPTSMAQSGSGSPGRTGSLLVEMENGFRERIALQAGVTSVIPLELTPGVHTITLTLDAGNFRPADYGSDDRRLLGFAIEQINLDLP